MLFNHQIHMLRLVVHESLSLNLEKNQSCFHINQLRNHCSRFMEPSLIKPALQVLCLLDELNSLGMGKYAKCAPRNIHTPDICIGFNGEDAHNIYPHAYISSKEEGTAITLSEFLGPPFTYKVKTGSVFYERTHSIDRSKPKRGSIYWADYCCQKPSENWVDINTKRDGTQDGLYRVEFEFYKEFHQIHNSSMQKLSGEEAYQLAALKDYLKGFKYPINVQRTSTGIWLKPMRFVPSSIIKLLQLMCSATDVQNKDQRFLFTADSFAELQRLVTNYLIFFDSSR